MVKHLLFINRILEKTLKVQIELPEAQKQKYIQT